MRRLLIILILVQFCQNYISAQTNETAPDYLLKLHGPWKTHESDHFIIYYRENPQIKLNLKENDLEEIAKNQEENRQRIFSLLSIPNNEPDSLRKIKIWLFSSLKEKTDITKINSTDFSIPSYWSAYHTYKSANSAHEIGHLLFSVYLGNFKSKKYQFLIEEGLASYVDEFNGSREFDYRKKAKKILRDKKYSIENIVNNVEIQGIFKNPYTQKAIISGAFVKFLIKEHGIEKFGVLWKKLDNKDESIFEKVYGKNFSILVKDFNLWLNK